MKKGDCIRTLLMTAIRANKFQWISWCYIDKAIKRHPRDASYDCSAVTVMGADSVEPTSGVVAHCPCQLQDNNSQQDDESNEHS